jgi:murein tripeptide amidase MpaA
MAEWFAEGLLERLTAEQPDAEAQQLLGSAVLYVVPNMCPDGSVRWGCVWKGGGVNRV